MEAGDQVPRTGGRILALVVETQRLEAVGGAAEGEEGGAGGP